jgi:RNA polymerase sigma-70 factor (ECF subfamily)
MICYHPATEVGPPARAAVARDGVLVLMNGGAQPAATTGPLAGHEALTQDLYQRSGGERLGIARAAWDSILGEIVRKYLPAAAAPAEVADLLRGLRVEELALARACAAGNEKAWEIFLTQFREKLYDSAAAIAHDDATARELADSLYADLYGTTTREGRRVSKLASYTGRGSLQGWLRTVLAQEFVNRYRAQRRNVSLEEQEEAGAQFAAPAAAATEETDPRVPAATDAALAALPPEQRYVLAAYFLDGRTLAEIARALGVHESTISRKLEKIVTGLRKGIREGLVARGMSRRQAEEAMQSDVRDLAVDVRTRLQETAAPPFSSRERPELK